MDFVSIMSNELFAIIAFSVILASPPEARNCLILLDFHFRSITISG